MSATLSPRTAGLCCVGVCLLGVLLVGVSAAGQPVLDGEPPRAIVAVENTTAYLQPEGTGETRQAVVRQHVDVGTAVSANARGLGGQLDRLAVQRRVEAGEDESEILDVLRSETDTLERRIENLSDAHRETRRGYRNGTLSSEEFVRRLAVLQAEVDSVETRRMLLERRAVALETDRAGPTVTTLQNLEIEVETLSGPVTGHLLKRFTGDRSRGSTLVSATGNDGFVLATVVDGQFYREALDPSQRSAGGTNRFATSDVDEITAAISRAAELYSWAFDNGGGSASLEGYGDTPVYRITVGHTQGELQTYLDGVTENAFKETQQKRVDAVPTAPMRTVSEGELAVAINGTHPTGPLEVTVQRSTTDSPVDAVVRIDGTRVGSTGDDGRLWTVQPDGAFSVNATTSGGTAVDVTISG